MQDLIMNKLNPEKQIDLHDGIIEDTSDRYGIETYDWEPVAEGIGNVTALLRSREGLFYAKYYRSTHTQEKLEDEIALMLRLQGEVPIPETVNTKDGDYYSWVVTDDKKHLMTLTKEVRGWHPQSYTLSLAGGLAAAHAFMHTATHLMPNTAPFNIRSDYNFKIEDLNSKEKEINEKAEAYLESLESAWNSLPTGLVHLDIARRNILTNGICLTAIIDFEDTSFAPYVFCLAGTLWDIKEGATSDIDAIYDHYLEYYESVRPLQHNERKVLDRMVFLRGWIALHGNLLSKGDDDVIARQMAILIA